MESNEKALVERDDSLPFKIMDALDDQLIIQELEGRLPEILTYHFEDKGMEIWGLSKSGVDEATGELGKQGEVIRELEMNFIDGEKDAYFNVKAGRFIISKGGQEVLLDVKFGTKRQPKQLRKRDGTIADNPFWYEQGAMKAARNASMRLIPATIKQAVIEYARQKGRVKEVKKGDIPIEATVESEPFNQNEVNILYETIHSAMVGFEKQGNKLDFQKYWAKTLPQISKLPGEMKSVLVDYKVRLLKELK